MISSQRCWSRDRSRPLFNGLGLGLGLDSPGLGLGLGLSMPGLDNVSADI